MPKVRKGVKSMAGFGTRSWQITRGKSGRAALVAAARGMNRATRGMQLARGELKSVDTTVAGAVINATGALNLVNGIARGDDINERTGREVTLKSIHCRFEPYSTATTGQDQWGRIIVVYDRQTNGAAMTIAQLLTAVTPIAMRNLENRKRFSVLYDKTFTLNSSILGAVQVPEAGGHKYFEFYRRLNHPMVFNSGDAGTVADITSGSVYVITLGSENAGATAGACHLTCRIRYEDK